LSLEKGKQNAKQNTAAQTLQIMFGGGRLVLPWPKRLASRTRGKLDEQYDIKTFLLVIFVQDLSCQLSFQNRQPHKLKKNTKIN
jgi:hypothetical protein